MGPVEGPDSLLELESRRRIYEHLRRAPGLHLRQIQRDLELPLGTLEYHLHQMEKAGLLVTREPERYKAYYPNEDLSRHDRDYLYYLRQAMPRRIALEVVHQPGVTFKQLVARLPIGPSTLSFHLKKLRRAGIVEEARQGREATYRCMEPDRVRALIIRYRPTFMDDVVDRFAEAWIDVGPRPPEGSKEEPAEGE